ncbi:hypothetical protein D9M71_630950 [compost metagenome]
MATSACCRPWPPTRCTTMPCPCSTACSGLARRCATSRARRCVPWPLAYCRPCAQAWYRSCSTECARRSRIWWYRSTNCRAWRSNGACSTAAWISASATCHRANRACMGCCCTKMNCSWSSPTPTPCVNSRKSRSSRLPSYPCCCSAKSSRYGRSGSRNWPTSAGGRRYRQK